MLHDDWATEQKTANYERAQALFGWNEQRLVRRKQMVAENVMCERVQRLSEVLLRRHCLEAPSKSSLSMLTRKKSNT